MLTKSVGLVRPRAAGVTFGSRNGGEPLGKRRYGPHGMDAPAKGS